jgi:ABC-2 type transport system permease protein
VIRLVGLYLDRARFEIRLVLRDRRAMMFSALLPIFLMFIFGSVFRNQTIGATHVTLSQYIVAGLVASGILYSSFQLLAISVPEERSDGTLKRIVGTPMPPSVYFIGKVAASLFIYVLQIVFLLGLGTALFNIHLPHSVGLWLIFAWVSLLGVLSCSMLGMAYSASAKDGQAASAMAVPLVLFFQFTSGVFFVYTSLPKWMQTVAAVFPLKWVAQAMRGVFLPASFGLHEAGRGFEFKEAAVILVAWTIGSMALCRLTFRWLPKGSD